jgi:hypothetical protein
MVFQIWEVVEKHNAPIAMLLDWFCNIFDFVINFSPSFPNGVESSLMISFGYPKHKQTNFKICMTTFWNSKFTLNQN